MIRSLVLVCVVLQLVTAGFYDPATGVIELTSENFEEQTAKYPVSVLVLLPFFV